MGLNYTILLILIALFVNFHLLIAYKKRQYLVPVDTTVLKDVLPAAGKIGLL